MNLTMQSLGETLRAQLETKRDVVADTRRCSFALRDSDWAPGSTGEEPPDITFGIDMPDGAEAFLVTRHAHNQIAEHLGVPFKLYERLQSKHPDLLVGLGNGLLNREPAKRLIRTMDVRMRAFLSDRYRPRDNWDLLENLLPVFAEHPGTVFRACQLTDTRMYVKASIPGMEIQVTPAVGDVVHGGAIISNSEVGSGSLYIYPYTTRLSCLNGAVHTEYGQRRIHVGRRIESDEEAYEFYSDSTMRLDDAAFFAKCTDTLRAVLNHAVFDAIVGQMRDLSEIRVQGSPVDAVEVIAKRQGFADGEKASILGHLIEGGDLSGWGYVNAITSTARDLENADRQAEMQTVAGRMISDPGWALAAA